MKSATTFSNNHRSEVVLMVLTREIDSNEPLSRLNTIRSIAKVLGSEFKLETFTIKSLVEQRSYLSFVFGLMVNIIFGRPRLPLQCLLFFRSYQIAQLTQKIAEHKPSAVYFDTIRCARGLLAVRKRFPNLHIVCDYDDLMSRRFNLIQRTGQKMSLGYISHYLPPFLIQAFESKMISGLILGREERLLRDLEKIICSMSQKITLVSNEDAKEFRSNCGEASSEKLIVIPPPFSIIRPLRRPEGALRFIFIGSDRQTQNRDSIDWLIQLWGEKEPAYPLHIFGRQQRCYPNLPGVSMEGFVERYEDIYTSGSIVISPSFLGGGIKTKILEALSWGMIALGTEISFEGMGLEENRLSMTETELARIPFELDDRLDDLTRAAEKAQAQLNALYGEEAQKKKWVAAMH